MVSPKGYTSYAIGLVVTDIVKAILRSQERVLTASGLVEGLYEIDNVCLDLPRVINELGILKTVNLNEEAGRGFLVNRKSRLKLSPTETKQLEHSAEVLQNVFRSLNFGN